MPRDLRPMLNETERALLRETEQLDRLDEDELVALHDRVRRARTKYTKLYRRRAAAQVTSDAARARAHTAHAKAAAKAELFEDALARVSRQLATEAKAAAAALKRERLAMAKADRAAPTSPSRPAARQSTAKESTAPRSKPRTPASEKQRASTKAATQRRQATRDRRSKG